MSEAPQDKPKRRWGCFRVLFTFTLIVIVLIALAGIVAGLGGYLLYDHVTRPRVGGPAEPFHVPEGATGNDVGVLLAKKGLIEHEVLFRVAAKLDERGGTIRHGEYQLKRGESPLQLLHALYERPVVAFDPDSLPDDQKVTVPEGLSLSQTAALFDDPQAFLDAAADPELIARIGLDLTTLEGFLMPDTYYFDAKPTEREVVERMVDHHLTRLEAIRADIPELAERDLIEVMTVASLIEEEARVDAERPLVAAVIYNRIEKGMRLDMDSTLQYALGKYGQRMLDADKEVDSPYNTYKNAGLPPGPISSPGPASIRAALSPADVEYLYFVSNADGKTHTFSTTLAEHNRAVARYRRDVAEQRRQQAAGES